MARPSGHPATNVRKTTARSSIPIALPPRRVERDHDDPKGKGKGKGDAGVENVPTHAWSSGMPLLPVLLSAIDRWCVARDWARSCSAQPERRTRWLTAEGEMPSR